MARCDNSTCYQRGHGAQKICSGGLPTFRLRIAAFAAMFTITIFTVMLLPKGAVRKQDQFGHWSFHTPLEGDQLPDNPEEMDHHCRTCGMSGSADSALNAYFASVTIGVEYVKGLFPCHTFACTSAGLYFRRISDEQHEEYSKRSNRRIEKHVDSIRKQGFG